MAFAGAISDLFNCGRPRKPPTRDGTKSGEHATRSAGATLNHGSDDRPLSTSSDDNATPQLGVGGGRLHVSPFAFSPPIDLNLPTIRASTESNAVRRLEHGPEEAPEGRTRPAEVSDQRPPKPGKGTQIEKRILVTTDTPDASLAAFDLDLPNVATASVETAPVVKDTDTDYPFPVEKDEPRLEEVEIKASNASEAFPVESIESRPDDVEKKTSDATAPFAVESDETKSKQCDTKAPSAAEPPTIETNQLGAEDFKEDVKEAAIPEPEAEVKLPEELPATSTSISIPVLSEDNAVDAMSEVQDSESQVAAAAPTQFLDLPTEVRSLIYEHMIEDSPIRMIRHDDPALSRSEAIPPRRQFYNLTQVCQQLRKEFVPLYEQRTEYIIDLWTQRANLTDISALKGAVAIDIDAACFDMQPIDLLPLIRYLARTKKAGVRFASTEGVVFRSIESIVEQLNELLPASDGRNANWLAAVNGPMKRVDLHLFPHEDIRAYYRFRGAEPMLRIVYPARATEDWMKQSHKVGGEYESYLQSTGLDGLEMHVVVGHASRRTTNEGRMPLNWRLSYIGSRLSIDQAVRISGQWTRPSIDQAVRSSGQWTR